MFDFKNKMHARYVYYILRIEKKQIAFDGLNFIV